MSNWQLYVGIYQRLPRRLGVAGVTMGKLVPEES